MVVLEVYKTIGQSNTRFMHRDASVGMIQILKMIIGSQGNAIQLFFSAPVPKIDISTSDITSSVAIVLAYRAQAG